MPAREYWCMDCGLAIMIGHHGTCVPRGRFYVFQVSNKYLVACVGCGQCYRFERHFHDGMNLFTFKGLYFRDLEGGDPVSSYSDKNNWKKVKSLRLFIRNLLVTPVGMVNGVLNYLGLPTSYFMYFWVNGLRKRWVDPFIMKCGNCGKVQLYDWRWIRDTPCPNCGGTRLT